MKIRRWRNRIILAIVIAAALGAAAWRYGDDVRAKLDRSDQAAGETVQTELSAWVAEWDWEKGISDMEEIAQSLDSVQLFGAYFNEQDQLMLRDGFTELYEAVGDADGEHGYKRYLTIVNDILLADGTSLQKDSGLVSRLAADDNRSGHINAIVGMAREYGFDGVELDYERIAGKDWPHVISLFGELHQALQAAGMQLRIVLEPGVPFTKHRWPEGPEYVVMAYNLYGTHSGPGPKADVAMIGKLAAKLDHLPGNSVIAFATGGFNWGPDGAAAVTEAAAAELAEAEGVEPQRDKDSSALYFSYTDENGAKHTVWYADSETLRGWIEAAKQRGIYRAAIWRLGGLSQASLDYLGQLQIQ